jgi:hypothetical protein
MGCVSHPRTWNLDWVCAGGAAQDGRMGGWPCGLGERVERDGICARRRACPCERSSQQDFTHAGWEELTRVGIWRHRVGLETRLEGAVCGGRVVLGGWVRLGGLWICRETVHESALTSHME